MVRGRGVVLLAAMLATVPTAGCIGTLPALDAEGATWEAGSAIFEDDRWLGGDGAITVDLGDGRILWLFGDSRVAPEGERSRDEAFFVSNTMAIQRGADPSDATVTFHWGQAEQDGDGEQDPLEELVGEGDEEGPGNPAPIVPDEQGGEIAHWPGHGAMIEDQLVLFYTRIERGEGPFGFQDAGWTAFRVADPSGPPETWQLEEMQTPRTPLNLTVGAGSVLVQDEHLLAYAVHSHEDGAGWTRHDPMLVRWHVEDVLAGDLTDPAWYTGDGEWTREARLPDEPAVLFEPGAPGWSVHHEPARDVWVQVQISSFPTGPIELRTAPAPTGPWSDVRAIHEPPEVSIAGASVYLGYGHPDLAGADLVVGYSTGALDEEAREQDPGLGKPRLATIDLEP